MSLLQQLQSAWRSLGRFPAHRVTWGLAAVFCVWAVLDVMVFHVSSGLSLSTYDAMVRARFHTAAADPRVVIVDIDEASLARMGKEFGQWPWPRDTLATVLDHIEKQQPAAVVWDVVFSDADLQNPGGDAAFNTATQQSPHSHFSVVRLPPANDHQSQITRTVLPGLWVKAAAPVATVAPTSASRTATVALIPPALPAVAASRLGYNNGYVDADGVLRRYRYAERLGDGSVIQSLSLSVLSAMDTVAASALSARASTSSASKKGDTLIAYRAAANTYPRVAFADVFTVAEGGAPQVPVPSFAGKVVIVGSTAPSLHDIHPTPLSPHQNGVDSLATALDNALNQRYVHELPQGLLALLACVLFIGMALWVGAHGVSSLAPVTLVLPAVLLGISYLTLNGSPVFVDLHLSAGLGLLFLASLRTWNGLRRDYWCRMPRARAKDPEPMLAWVIVGNTPWVDGHFDRLLSAVQKHAPQCRVVAVDAVAVWPSRLHWPELACVAAVVGPATALQLGLAGLQTALGPLLASHTPLPLRDVTPETLLPTLFRGWSALQNSVTNHATERPP